MAAIYVPADTAVRDLAAKVQRDYHPEQVQANVDFGIQFVISSNDAPPLKENGHKVEGMIIIVPPRDRASKGFLLELFLDADEWKAGRNEHHAALLDELFARIEVRKQKPKKKRKQVAHGTDEEQQTHEEKEFLQDANGRPLLRKRPGDVYVGSGYLAVVERHGEFTPVCRKMWTTNAMLEPLLKAAAVEGAS